MKVLKGGIAFFDSGIGGLTVLAKCREYLPNALFYYYGDNRHAPYGNLSDNKIRRYVRKAFSTFARLKARAVVIACNTVTAVCIEELRKRYPFPIIGTEPAVQSAAKIGGDIFVLTTRATFESEKFKNLCQSVQSRYPQTNIQPQPCDGLAGAIEKHLTESEFDFTPFFPRGSPDVVVLGCTHYIYIEEAVRKYYACPTLHGNDGVARRLMEVLKKEGALTTEGGILEEYRDRQPHLTTPKFKARKKRQEGAKNRQNVAKNNKIIFLGKCQVVNKTQYEQMFACKNG